MIVDVHSHLYPPEMTRRLEASGVTLPFAPDAPARLLEAQRQAGVDVSLISNPFVLQRAAHHGGLDPVRTAALYHRWVAELCQRPEMHGHLVPLALAAPLAGEPMLAELDVALGACGCVGIMINPSFAGAFCDGPDAEPFWAYAEARGVPVFYHPSPDLPWTPAMEDFRLVEAVARPTETTLGLARLALRGVLARHPALRLIAAHAGGTILALPGRLDYVHELRGDPGFGPWDPHGLGSEEEPPSHALRRIAVDTMCFHPQLIRLAASWLGPEHVLLGSDHPPVSVPLERSLRAVHDAHLEDVAADAAALVLGGNACRLFGLPRP